MGDQIAHHVLPGKQVSAYAIRSLQDVLLSQKVLWQAYSMPSES